MTIFSVLGRPLVFPAHDTALAEADYFFNLEAGSRSGVKVALPEPGYRFPAQVECAIGGRLEVLDPALFAYQLYHGLGIMAIEGLVEFNDHAHGRFQFRHSDWTHR
jgi:hypothetical protein